PRHAGAPGRRRLRGDEGLPRPLRQGEPEPAPGDRQARRRAGRHPAPVRRGGRKVAIPPPRAVGRADWGEARRGAVISYSVAPRRISTWWSAIATSAGSPGARSTTSRRPAAGAARFQTAGSDGRRNPPPPRR